MASSTDGWRGDTSQYDNYLFDRSGGFISAAAASLLFYYDRTGTVSENTVDLYGTSAEQKATVRGGSVMAANLLTNAWNNVTIENNTVRIENMTVQNPQNPATEADFKYMVIAGAFTTGVQDRTPPNPSTTTIKLNNNSVTATNAEIQGQAIFGSYVRSDTTVETRELEASGNQVVLNQVTADLHAKYNNSQHLSGIIGLYAGNTSTNKATNNLVKITGSTINWKTDTDALFRIAAVAAFDEGEFVGPSNSAFASVWEASQNSITIDNSTLKKTVIPDPEWNKDGERIYAAASNGKAADNSVYITGNTSLSGFESIAAVKLSWIQMNDVQRDRTATGNRLIINGSKTGIQNASGQLTTDDGDTQNATIALRGYTHITAVNASAAHSTPFDSSVPVSGKITGNSVVVESVDFTREPNAGEYAAVLITGALIQPFQTTPPSDHSITADNNSVSIKNVNFGEGVALSVHGGTNTAGGSASHNTVEISDTSYASASQIVSGRIKRIQLDGNN